MLKISLMILFAISLVSCGNDDKRLKEKTRMEGETLTSVENNNLAAKAAAMEKDLTRRHRFYQAVKGNYEGEIDSNLGSFKIRITLTPSLPPLQVDRIRQLNEIEFDLNNLMLNTQVVIWDPGSSSSAVGCRISNVRPNIETGELTLSDESCPNLYRIKVFDPATSMTAREVARAILNNNMYDVQSLSGSVDRKSVV